LFQAFLKKIMVSLLTWQEKLHFQDKCCSSHACFLRAFLSKKTKKGFSFTFDKKIKVKS